MNLIESARQLIATDSTPSQGTADVARLAGELCREVGLETSFHPEQVDDREEVNFLAWSKASGYNGGLLLQTHLDTSPPGNFAMWGKTANNPFNASVHDDTIFGLGVAGAKMDFLAKILAVSEYANTTKFSRPLVLSGTFGHSNGMIGVNRLLRRKLVNPEMALVGEPTELRLVAKGSGTAVLELSIPFSKEEKDYHRRHDVMESSSTQSKIFAGNETAKGSSSLSENAILKMLTYLGHLPSGMVVMDLDGGTSALAQPEFAVLELDLVDGFNDTMIGKLNRIHRALMEMEQDFSRYQNEGDHERPVINVGQIKTYPDEVRISGACTLPPTVSDEQYQVWMERLRQSCAEVGSTLRVVDYCAAFSADDKSQLVSVSRQVMQDMQLDPGLNITSARTEASWLQRRGVNCLVFGPGKGTGNVHSPNENVSIAEVKKASEFYKRVIERVCL